MLRRQNFLERVANFQILFLNIRLLVLLCFCWCQSLSSGPPRTKEGLINIQVQRAQTSGLILITNLFLLPYKCQKKLRDQLTSQVGDHDNRTPLHIAAALGHVDIVKTLIWNKSDVNAIDRSDADGKVIFKIFLLFKHFFKNLNCMQSHLLGSRLPQ